jgi:hypothetical protein
VDEPLPVNQASDGGVIHVNYVRHLDRRVGDLRRKQHLHFSDRVFGWFPLGNELMRRQLAIVMADRVGSISSTYDNFGQSL